MSIESDYDTIVAASLREEIALYGQHCHYDENKKKLIYDSAIFALQAYNGIQVHEWAKHGIKVMTDDLDWITSYSTLFRKYWTKTHMFIISGD